MATFQQRLQQVQVEAPTQSGSLQIFGLRAGDISALKYQTLDEAIQAKLLEVTEVSEGGSVPTLKLTNHSDSRVFLLAGEQLVGAKQNRILNTSVMVEGHSTIPIPVSCVEQSRWSYRSRQFSSSSNTSHSRLRQTLTKSVSESYLHAAAPMSDQGAVWGEVSRKLTSMGSVSGTMAMEKVYEDREADLSGMVSHVSAPENCVGAVFAIHGKIIGLDMFDQPETLKKLWEKIVRGYAIDAIEQGKEAGELLSTSQVQTWLTNTSTLPGQAYPSPGIGEDYRVQSPNVTGSMLVVESESVHTQLFAEATA